MKRISKKLIFLLVIIVFIYIAFNVAIVAFGKGLVVSQIENSLKRKTTLGNISVGFPLSVNISKLEVEGLLTADFISASPSLLGFLTGRIVLNELRIIHPVVTLERGSDGRFNIPGFEGSSKQPPLLLAGLKVRRGNLIFIDKKLTPSGYRLSVSDINANISKVSFPPTSLFTRFNLRASILDDQNVKKGDLLASGWIDFRPKDMDGKIELKNVEATLLSPYYENLFTGKKLISAKLNFTSDLKAKNNNLNAKCHVEFSDLVYEKPKETAEEEKVKMIDLFPKALDLFSNDMGNVIFDFTINTKLDSPKLDIVNLRGSIAEAAAQNVLSQPPDKIVEKVKDTVKEFKEFGKSMKEIFKKKDE